MIRMPRAGGDAAEEKKRIEEENKVARIVTFQNVLSFFVVCGLIRAVGVEWIDMTGVKRCQPCKHPGL